MKMKFKIGDIVQTRKDSPFGGVKGKVVGHDYHEWEFGRWPVCVIEVKPGFFEIFHQDYLKRVKE